MYKALFLATVVGTSGGPGTPTIETIKVEFTEGFDLMGKCREFEKEYHVGNGSITTRGNKLISTYAVRGGQHVTIETMCLEQK